MRGTLSTEDVTRSVRDLLSSGRVMQMASFAQHGDTSTLDHCVDVTAVSLGLVVLLPEWIPVDEVALIRGAMLHDYFLYDWHDSASAPDRWHGFTHPSRALHNACEDFPDLGDAERDTISHHMFPLVPIPPTTVEGVLVCVADKVCAVREVARAVRRRTGPEGE